MVLQSYNEFVVLQFKLNKLRYWDLSYNLSVLPPRYLRTAFLSPLDLTQTIILVLPDKYIRYPSIYR